MKQINIENSPFYFFNDIISINNFDSNLLNTYKISFKSTDVVIYNIIYITMKSFNHINIDNGNPLHLMFNNGNGYIEEKNGDKYLVFASTDKNKEMLEKYSELQNKVKN